MLQRSQSCRVFEGRYGQRASLVLFSNLVLREPVECELFSLTPTVWTQGVPTYVLDATIFSPAPAAGVRLTPENYALDQLRLLLSFFLDGIMTSDLNAVRTLCRSSDATNESPPTEFIADRFEFLRTATAAETVAAVQRVEQVVAFSRDDYGFVIRAASAYETAFSIIEYQLDLSYALLVFALESTAQSVPRDKSGSWKNHPMRTRVDSILIKRSVEPSVADELRGVLSGDGTARAQRHFVEFVVSHIPDGFFVGNGQFSEALIRGSRLRRMLEAAYSVRSGYVHGLAPLTESMRLSRRTEVCVLDHEQALTVRGLHRLVRGVVSTFISRRSRNPPSFGECNHNMPGTVGLKAPTDFWVNQAQPKSNGSDLRLWFEGLLEMHVVKCVRKVSEPEFLGVNLSGHGVLSFFPGTCYPISAIGEHVRRSLPQTSERYQEAAEALVRICGLSSNAPSQISTIEALVAEVFVTPSLDPRLIDSAEKTLLEYLRKVPSKRVRIPLEIDLAVMVALSHALWGVGEKGRARLWWKTARDDAAGCPAIQQDLMNCEEDIGSVLTHTDILFPGVRGPEQRLLFGLRAED